MIRNNPDDYIVIPLGKTPSILSSLGLLASSKAKTCALVVVV